MKKILTILLLACSAVASGQNLRKLGSTGSTSTLFGDFFYLSHPTYGVADSLKLADKKYVDQALASAGAGSAFGIDTTVIGGTVGSVLFVGTGPVLAQDNTNLFWDDGNDRLRIGTTTGTERLRVTGRGYFTDTLTSANVLKAGSFVQGATVAATIMTRGEARALAGFNTTDPALNNNTFTGLISNELRYANTQTLAFQNIGSNVVAVNQIALTGTYNPTSGSGANMNTLNIAPSVVPPSGSNSLTYNMINIQPIINQTAFGTGITRGLHINPTLTSAADWRSIEVVSGPVMLNTTSGRTQIGTNAASANIVPRKLYAGGSVGFHKDSIPTVTSITSEFVLLEDTASGADLGRVKKILPSYFATQSALNDTAAAIRAAGGGGGGITSINSETGPAIGITSANGIGIATTTNTVTATWGGTLNQATQILGASQNLTLGTSGSKINILAMSAATASIVSDGRLNLLGNIAYAAESITGDANATVAANIGIVEIITSALTADRTLTLPSATTQGQLLTIVVRFASSGFHFDLASAIENNATGSNVTQLQWGTTYKLMVNASLVWMIIEID